MHAPRLPIDDVLPALRDVLRRDGRAVLVAPPGAGKTTRVPLALVDEPWCTGRVLMLEPRRLAARAAAHHMARLLGEAVGETVGYRVHLESRVSSRTRIEVVTEGVLTRMLRDDATLDGVAAVLFDEFHERSLHADLGLALTLHAAALIREDLRLVVMSATLDASPVAALLGGAPVIESQGRLFPVTTEHRAPREGQRADAAAAAAVRSALAETTGDVLVFLPGQGEIARAASLLEGVADGIDVIPLYGAMPLDAQDRAIQPSPAGRRKVVLATSIAETSLTIEGVRVVIDSGLARVPRFEARSGMTRLATTRVSRAAADQRRGRAGRLGPGHCYRLWPEGDDAQLLAHRTPEILDADLAPLALELAAAGIGDPRALRWLDAPPEGAWRQGQSLLRALDALDANGRITAHGRRLATLGAHPRLAHLVARGTALGFGSLACDVAALLGERDLFSRDAAAGDADLADRVRALRDPEAARSHGADRGRVQRVRQEADALRRGFGITRDASDARDADARDPDARDAAVGILVALAYPDRLARQRPGEPGRYLLRNGRGATFAVPQPLGAAEWLAIADVDGDPRESRIWMAAAIEATDVMAHFAAQCEDETVRHWDAARRRLTLTRISRLGAIPLRERRLDAPSADEAADALLAVVRDEGWTALLWDDRAARLRERMTFAHQCDPQFPDVSDDALRASLSEWLRPALLTIGRLDGLSRVDVADALSSRLTWKQRERLDVLAPTHCVVPSGSRLPIDYGDPAAPTLAVRLQELFGLADTPRVGDGRVPLTLALLSPAHRPVQVTRDLAGFWARSYFDVRKDLRGRYPKHHWPENPLEAQPTARAKRRGE
ncbi:MAG: ATP-dependent helicase HrpB [Gemmatimonadota bacterium]|nr:ATP-dependent helicase HrpB [Gemmatimonadota bacterium]